MAKKGSTAAAPEAAAPQTESTGTAAATKKDLAVVKGNGAPATAITVSVKVPKGAKERGLSPEQWQVLREVIFPGAYDETVKDKDGRSMFDEAEVDLAVLVAYDYCQARKLDIMKKPLHIVPMWDGKRRKMVPKHWPAISELRITASRTRCYAGKDAPKFGPLIEMQFDDYRLEVPENCTVTVYKIVQGQRCPFEGTVWWNEAYGRRGKTVTPNAMWQKRKFGQLAKCAEAEALRAAFPEELGGIYTAEEMRDQEVESMIDVTPAAPAADEPAPTLDLVLMDGEIESHPDPEAWVAALGDLVENHYPVASADAVRGNWETNAPMFDEPEFADYHTSAQPALQAAFMAIYGKLSLARDLANDAKPGTEKPSGESTAQEASGETMTETSTIDWLKWVPWFAGKVKQLGKEDAQELVLQHADDLAVMQARKTKGAAADWKNMAALLTELGLELGGEEYD